MPKIVTSSNTNVIQNVHLHLNHGTAANPSVAFTGSTTTGLYRAAVDSVGFAANGSAVGNYSATGAWTLGPAAGAVAQTHTIQSGSDITLEVKSFGTSGITNSFRLISGSTSGNSDVRFYNGGTLKGSITADNLNSYGFGVDAMVFRQFSVNVAAVTISGGWTIGRPEAIGGNTFPGAKIVGKNDGAAIPAGYVGEMLGTLSSGTGGFTYKTTTTDNWTNSTAARVSITLNQGVYLVSAFGKLTGSAGGAGNASFNLRVGGTAVTSTGQGQYAQSGEWAWSIPMIPIIISSASTAVAVWSTASGTSSNTVNDLYVIRIA